MKLAAIGAGPLLAALLALCLRPAGVGGMAVGASDAEGASSGSASPSEKPRDVVEAARQLALDGYEYPNLFDEAMPMLWMSRLVYTFSYIVNEARKPENKLKINPYIDNEFKDKRLDVRDLNDGHGLSFYQIYDEFIGQVDELKRVKAVDPYDLTVIERLKAVEDKAPGDQLFLEVFDSIDEKYECVYGVFKDELRKRIIIAFRGSVTPNDWMMNLSAQLVNMKIPRLLQGAFGGKEHVNVHRGFYEYLFKNEKTKGDQIYDKILGDIQPFVEEGYRIYVTGHSLGAALASMLAFKLAGSRKDWIPKPVTCISFESPFAAGSAFKAAFQKLEADGMMRYLRVTNSRDIVPALPPFSLGFRNKGLYQHVGVHLDFANRGTYSISYPRKGRGRWRRAFRNSILKPIWSVLHYHDLKLVDERMYLHRKELSNMTINDIYKDESIVGDIAVRDEL